MRRKIRDYAPEEVDRGLWNGTLSKDRYFRKFTKVVKCLTGVHEALGLILIP